MPRETGPYLINDGGTAREMVRHVWVGARHKATPAHPAPPRPVRQTQAHRLVKTPRTGWGAAGMLLAVAAVPLSWAALLTGAGIPHGGSSSYPVRLPGIHATHLPDITRRPVTPGGPGQPGETGQPDAGTTPTPAPSASPSATGSPASPAPDASRKPKGKPSKPVPPVPTGLPTPTLPVPSCMTSKPPHVRRSP
jgi:hypothetical protein